LPVTYADDASAVYSGKTSAQPTIHSLSRGNVEAFPEPGTHSVLPDDVHQQLWDRINARIERGDALITTKDYVVAVTSEYEAITG
jgi:hypothetical protein